MGLDHEVSALVLFLSLTFVLGVNVAGDKSRPLNFISLDKIKCNMRLLIERLSMTFTANGKRQK